MPLKSFPTLAILAPVAVLAGLSGIVAAVGQPAPPSAAPISGQTSGQTSGTLRLDGEVREIFGNKVVVEGPAGRVLVETGPDGRMRAALAPGDKVTIDGVQRDGFVHASAVTKSGGPRIELGRGPDAGPGDRPGGPRGADVAYREDAILQAVAQAGFRDAKVVDVKKRHAEVAAVAADGRSYELHVEFDGRIRKREDTTLVRDEGAIRTLVEKAGYSYGGQMRPEKKHMIVTATNARGEKVELDVHRDGTIRKERRMF